MCYAAAAELLLLLVFSVVVDYCCCYKYSNLLPMHMVIRCCEYLRHCCTNSIYNNPQQIYTGGAGEGGGFQSQPAPSRVS